MMLQKFFKDETGQSMILFAVAFTLLCGVAALAFDLGNAYVLKSNLQTAADAAALAGAQDLPNAGAAVNTALYYAGINEEGTQTVAVTPYGGDSGSIEVVCTKTVPYTFAQVLGITQSEVSARAVAAKAGPGRAFDYTLFSGDEISLLPLNGSAQYVKGDVHSNQGVMITASQLTVTGSVEAVSEFAIYGSSITIGGTCSGSSIVAYGSDIHTGGMVYTPAPVIAMPDFSDVILDQARAAGQVYNGNKNFYGSNIDLNDPIYVNGNVSMSASSVTGNGCILATGDINFSGSSLTVDPNVSVCYYSKNGNIQISGSNIVIKGILYAPKGTISIYSSNVTIYGRVIANRLQLYGSNYQIIGSPDDLGGIPSAGGIKLVE